MKGTIYKRGKKYSIIIELGRDKNGKRVQKWYSGFRTKAEAEKELIKILHSLENNSYVEPKNLVLGEYLELWLKNYVKVNLAATTYEGYCTNIRRHVIPYLGHIKLQKLQPLQIDQLYGKLRTNGRVDGKGGLSGKSVLYVHRNLREALQQAYTKQLIPKNPADFVKAPRVEDYEASFLKEDEIINLLAYIKDSDIFIPVLIAVSLGLRRGEVMGLKWVDVDYEAKKIHIRRNLVRVGNKAVFTSPKTKRSKRLISVPSSILEELKLHKNKQDEFKKKLGRAYKDEDLINCNVDGSLINPSNVSKKFKLVMRKLGFPSVRFHDLRHSNASLMLKYKVSPKVASARLGHSNIRIYLDLYSHIISEIDEEAAEKIDEGILKKDTMTDEGK